MDSGVFWRLIERSGLERGLDQRTGFLTDHLATLEPDEIADFQMLLDVIRKPADTYRLWGAAEVIFGSCSVDRFWYFVPWLIGCGRATFNAVVAQPDSLADVPQIRTLAGRPRPWPDDEWPEWEALNYVAGIAYQRRTGREDGLFIALTARNHVSPVDPAPDDKPSIDTATTYPLLLALFPPRKPDFGRIPDHILAEYQRDKGVGRSHQAGPS